MGRGYQDQIPNNERSCAAAVIFAQRQSIYRLAVTQPEDNCAIGGQGRKQGAVGCGHWLRGYAAGQLTSPDKRSFVCG
jgi:hypothetical protein